MRVVAQYFRGEHDFSAFGANPADGSVQNPIRTICGIEFEKFDRSIVLTVAGNGFLYKMVRMLVGSFVMLGLDQISDGAVLDALFHGKRKFQIEAAPARGLFLHSVQY
jgi:tRNA pseudouridine38-40 synthase